VPLDVRPEPTPNPNAVRFALSSSVLGDAPRSFANAGAAKGTPWAERIFGLPGVQSVFGMKDFLTVVKTPSADWSGIVDPVARILSTDLA
jgi:hypothetical protein